MRESKQARQPRGYTMGARQESVEETRQRITVATMNLHERVGPRHTTVSAIAEEAGVTRLTVYRHFPDDSALVGACSAHWSTVHPRPEVSGWEAFDDPVQRLRTALLETYRWARTAAPMMTMIHRDLDVMPDFVAQFLAAGQAKPHRRAGPAVRRASCSAAAAGGSDRPCLGCPHLGVTVPARSARATWRPSTQWWRPPTRSCSPEPATAPGLPRPSGRSRRATSRSAPPPPAPRSRRLPGRGR